MCMEDKSYKWVLLYRYAEKYFREKGDLLVPTNYKVNGYNLGQWISHQRQYYKDGKLYERKIELLNSIGMIWEAFQYKWSIGFNYARQYYEKHKDLIMAANYSTDDFKLGKWICHQRDNYKNSALEKEKIELLNSIEMIWDIHEYQWNIGFNYAKQYSEEHGNLAIIINYVIDDFKLGQWISEQRKRYKNSTLSQEKFKALNSINMIWYKNEYDWEVGFYYAEQYYKEFNNLKVHVKYKTLNDNYPLGSWISHQRQARNGVGKGVITQVQVDRLNNIEMIWDGNKTNSITTSYAEQAIFYFMSLLFHNAICPYQKMGYDIDVYLPDIKLGIEYDGFYFHKDRFKKDYSKNEKCIKDGITLIRIREPGLKVFDNCVCYIRKSYYNKDLEKTIKWLIQYINKSFGKNLDLNINIENYKHKIIKNVGINSSKDWQNGFNFAKEYYEKLGNLDVKSDFIYKEFNLGKWLHYQRQAIKCAGGRVLSQDKRDLLDSIGMIWDPLEHK